MKPLAERQSIISLDSPYHQRMIAGFDREQVLGEEAECPSTVLINLPLINNIVSTGLVSRSTQSHPESRHFTWMLESCHIRSSTCIASDSIEAEETCFVNPVKNDLSIWIHPRETDLVLSVPCCNQLPVRSPLLFCTSAHGGWSTL